MSLKNYIAPVVISTVLVVTILIMAPSAQTIFSASTYEAPLERQSERAAPGCFIIHLHPGHSLEQHSAIIGTDTSSHVNGTLSCFKDLVSAIRADSGVALVQQDRLLIRQRDMEIEEELVG